MGQPAGQGGSGRLALNGSLRTPGPKSMHAKPDKQRILAQNRRNPR